ncbi:MAG: PD-(D/E)XK nuclease family protein, partial [Paludibacteraceae bacterium]|nr:PD-(D/E)XK nuclease family protein [Paludibacteraceae bacterium]
MYPTQLNDRLRLRMRPIKVAEQGTLMHEWLSRIKDLNDREKEKALQEMLEKGYITQNDVDKMNDEMDKFERLIEQFGIKEWFEKNDYQIYNERDILLSNGRTERPDRVLEKGDEVIIIDYKFGKKAEKHKTQVKNYMNLYEKMGKKAQGYIIYVEQETITEVK